MNKRQKAIRDKLPGYTMSAAEWEFATDDYKHLRKKKKMDNIQFKEYRDIISEGKFSKSLITKALKIAKKSGGQMTKAWKAIEKLAKGLGDDPTIADALKVANEEVVAEWNAGSRRCPGGDGRRKLLKGKTMSTEDEDEDEDEEDIEEGAGSYKKNAKIKVPHKGKKVTGKVVRYVPKKGAAVAYYVVYVNEYESIEVPEHKVKQYNEEVDWSYDYDLDEGREKEARQLVNPDKEVMVVKKRKVIVIDKKDQEKYLKKGWELAEGLEEKIRKGKEKDYIVTMIKKDGKEHSQIDYPTEKKAREAIKKGKFHGSAGMTFKLEKDGKSLKVEEVIPSLFERADRNEVMELKMFIENDSRLYKSKLVPIVKNIQKKMKSGKYDHKKAPKLWMYLVKDGVKLYAKEFDGLKFGKEVEKEVAQQLADEYRDEIEAQGGTMFESKFHTQFSDFREEDISEATGNEIKKYMKSKWKVGVKASKVGSKHMRAVGKIPNELRQEIIKKFMPTAKIMDKTNINYGNIMDNMITLRTEEWDKLINEALEVATGADLDALEAGLNEAKYKIDHKTFTSAVQEALKVADKAGYEVDEDDYFHQVATGPKKPSEGKTNKYSIALTKRGKPQKKALQIQIYGKGKHGFELNCYIS